MTQTDDLTRQARRRLVAVLAEHFHHGWSNQRIRDCYPERIDVFVDGQKVTFPASLLDDAFLENARRLYLSISADKGTAPKH